MRDILPLTAFFICKTEPPSCFFCKTDILWVVPSLVNGGNFIFTATCSVKSVHNFVLLPCYSYCCLLCLSLFFSDVFSLLFLVEKCVWVECKALVSNVQPSRFYYLACDHIVNYAYSIKITQ